MSAPARFGRTSGRLIWPFPPLRSEIVSYQGKGYALHCEDPYPIQRLIYQSFSLMTAEDRIRELLFQLIDYDDPIGLGELQDEFFISRSTLDSDLVLISHRYEQDMPRIHLIRSHDTLLLEPNEWKKRYLLNLLYSSHWNYNYEVGIQALRLPVAEGEFSRIYHFFEQTFREMQLRLGESDHVRFVFSLGIAISRIRSGHPIREGEFPPQADPKIQPVTTLLCDRLSVEVPVSFSPVERAAIAYEFSQRLRFNEEQLTNKYWEQHARERFAGVIERTLREVDKQNLLSLHENRMLKSELLFSLLSASQNPYYTEMQQREVIRSIRDDNPAAVWIAAQLVQCVQKDASLHLPASVKMEQAAYIAEALDGSLNPAPRIALISHLHISSSRYLMAKLRAFFGSRMELLGPFSVYEYEQLLKEPPDLILATTKLRRPGASPAIIPLSPALTDRNIETIDFHLGLLQKDRLFGSRPLSLCDFCEPETVRAERTPQNADEILNIIKAHLSEAGVQGDALSAMQFFSDTYIGDFILYLVLAPALSSTTVFRIDFPGVFEYDDLDIHCAYTLAMNPACTDSPLQALEHLVKLLHRAHKYRIRKKEPSLEENLREMVAALETARY